MKAVIERLESEWHRAALARNLESINGRQQADGYFPESLTGTYPGMFPRTMGALARLWSLTGDWDRLALSLAYVFQSRRDNRFDRIPHIVDRKDDNGRIPIYSDVDQVDGAAHVLLAWAILAEHDLELAESAAPFAQVAGVLDRSTDAPYLSTCTEWRIQPGLVLNTHFEHTREWNYWHAYDFLSQCFVGAALERLIPFAEARGESGLAGKWRLRHDFLRGQVAKSMARRLEDEREIYAEMLLPTGREPVLFDGVSWANLAPVPSGWTGCEEARFAETVRYWHEAAEIRWDGPRITACDWTPEGHTNRTLGKVIGWDLLASIRTGEVEIAAASLDFLEQVNTSELYAEILNYDPQAKTWSLRDSGNGEQAVWLAWAILEARRLAGLETVL